MLDLSDPLWEKLNHDGRHYENVPNTLAELATVWDDATATAFFYEILCPPQEGCYSAAYAAVPHLLKIAEIDANQHQRCEIAMFLGRVAFRATGHHESGTLEGFPETLDGWDHEFDSVRETVAWFDNPNRPIFDYERTDILPAYKRLLAIGPVTADDMPKILSIQAEFISSLPSIGALCERALLENCDDGDLVRFLLLGIAAAEGLLSLARLLDCGREGDISCSVCECPYCYRLSGERIAIYTDSAGVLTSPEERAYQDFKEEAPSRSDGFIIPLQDDADCGPRAARLLVLASRAPSPLPSLLLRNFLGRIDCRDCGVRARFFNQR